MGIKKATVWSAHCDGAGCDGFTELYAESRATALAVMTSEGWKEDGDKMLCPTCAVIGASGKEDPRIGVEWHGWNVRGMGTFWPAKVFVHAEKGIEVACVDISLMGEEGSMANESLPPIAIEMTGAFPLPLAIQLAHWYHPWLQCPGPLPLPPSEEHTPVSFFEQLFILWLQAGCQRSEGVIEQTLSRMVALARQARGRRAIRAALWQSFVEWDWIPPNLPENYEVPGEGWQITVNGEIVRIEGE